MLDKYRPYLIIFFLGILLYSLTAFFGFSYLDDHVLILENNPMINSVSDIGNIFVEDAFFSNSNFYYRPILNISFMLDSFISGPLPWFYHLVNVLLHILAACLVFKLLNKLQDSRFLGLFLALLFLFHPALVQAVAWIPGRNDSLLAIFILSSFLYFIKFLETPKTANYVGYVLFFLLALFTKEAAIFFPILLIFYYLFLSKKKFAETNGLISMFGATAAIFIWFLFRSLAMSEGSLTIYSVFNSILDNSPVLIIGLGKFFFPYDLSIMAVIRDAHVLYGLIAIALLFVVFIWKKGIKKEYFAFGLLWYFLFLVPSLINPESSSFYYVLEHRFYLPFIGLLIIISQIQFLQEINYKKFKSFLPFLLILVLSFSLAAYHLPNFQNRLIFWQSAVFSSPSSPIAHRNLGAMLYLDGRKDEAIVQYQLALQANKNEPMAHNNIGLIYMEKGDLQAAESEFKRELEINPGYDKTLINLNNLLILKNRLR
jgi:tetratricopeptide (TPR) repeat protein